MVSNARDDLPDPDRPVKTMSRSRGRSRETLRRLCSRAPRTISLSDIGGQATSEHSFDGSFRWSTPWLLVNVAGLVNPTGPDLADARAQHGIGPEEQVAAPVPWPAPEGRDMELIARMHRLRREVVVGDAP